MENKRYFGCYIKQRKDEDTVPFFVFYARAKDIKDWIGIKRVKNVSEGTQRVLKETRKKAITRFIQSDSKNTIPNSIIIAFEKGTTTFTSFGEHLNQYLYEGREFSSEYNIDNKCDNQIDWGFLEFEFEVNQPEHCRPALIIDGQHRFYGVLDYGEEDLPLLIVSLVDADPQEQAFQFIVINNKAVKVPTESVKSIIAHLNEEELQNRLLKAGVGYGKQSPVLIDINDLSSSPFQHSLDWSYNKKGIKLVSLTAIEQSLRYLKAQFNFLEKDEDTDSLVQIFCAIWRAIKKNYAELWVENHKFITKVNINAMNEFVAERLKYAWEFNLIDIFDTSTIETQIANMINNKIIPLEFWQADWSIKIQDNANVRKLIKEDLQQMAENYKMRRRWYEDLELPINSDIMSD